MSFIIKKERKNYFVHSRKLIRPKKFKTEFFAKRFVKKAKKMGF